MGFFFLLLYLALTYIRPWDLRPELAPLRMAFWAGMAGLVFSIIGFAVRGPASILRAPQVWFLLGFLVVLTFSPVAAQGWFGGALEALNQFLTSILGCVLILLNVSSLKRLRITVIALCLLSLAVTIQGLLAFHWGINRELFVLAQRAYWAENPREADPLNRLRGLGYLNDANDLAQALIAAIPLCWPAWRSRHRLRNFLFVIAPTALLVYGIFLTRSRGAIVSLMVLSLTAAREMVPRFRSSMPLLVTACVGLLMVAAGATGGRAMSPEDGSAGGRIVAWQAGLRMLLHSPIYGVGFGAFPDHHSLTAHNSFVLCFAELGLSGYFFWIALLVSVLQDLWTVGRTEQPGEEEPEDEDEEARTEKDALGRWARSLRLSFYAFLTGGFFLSRTYTPTLYLILGLAIAVADIARRSGYAGPRPQFLRVSLQSGLIVFASILAIFGMVVIGQNMTG